MNVVMVPVFALLAIVQVLGIVLLLAGLRGWLVSTHPHCRRCRFDLVGLAGGGDDPRCPECGASLVDPRSVQRGLRRKRPFVAWLGAALAIIPIGLIGSVVVIRSQSNIHALKPDFWLMIEARTSLPGTIGGQLSELTARMQAQSLNSADTQALIARALEVQADPNPGGGWNSGWGDILDLAAMTGLLSEEQFKQRARNAPRWSQLGRERIVEGDEWVICIRMDSSRVSNTSAAMPTLYLRAKLVGLRAGDRPIEIGSRGSTSMGIHLAGGSAMTMRCALPVLGPGVHELTGTWELEVAPDHDQPAIVSWTEDRTSTVTIEPTGSSGVDLIDDPGLQNAVLRSLELQSAITLTRSAGAPKGRVHASFYLGCDGPPMDLAFDVFLRERSSADAPAGSMPKEWSLGQVAFRSNGSSSHSAGKDLTDFDAAAVDLVLRPSIDSAKGTLEIYKIWNGEVWFRDVPINDPNATELANSLRTRPYPAGDGVQASPLPKASAP